MQGTSSCQSFVCIGRKNIKSILTGIHNITFINTRPKGQIKPNGFSDLEVDWLSPELLLRRISLLNTIANRRRSHNQPKLKVEKVPELIEKNFDNHHEVLTLITQASNVSDKFVSLFASKWMLRA